MDADGKADNGGDAALNNTALDTALSTAKEAVGDLVDAANGLAASDPSNYVGLTAAQQTAALTAAKGALNLAVANAQAKVTADQGDIAALDKADATLGLQKAIDAYVAADAAKTATAAAATKADADQSQALTYLETDAKGTVGAWSWDNATKTYTVSITVGTTTTKLFTIDESGNTYKLTLTADATEANFKGVTAYANASLADENAWKADTAAGVKLATAYTALDLADGGAADGDDTGIDAGDTPSYYALVSDKATLKTAQGDVTALDKALASLEKVAAIDTQRTTLEKAIAADELAIAKGGYDLNAAGYNFTDSTTDLVAGADANEKEIYTVKENDGNTITLGAGDAIVLAGYTLNTGAATSGNNSVLEYWMKEVESPRVS